MAQRMVAVDLVVTGRDPLESELIEFEAVAITEKGLGERFYALAKPAKPLTLREEKSTGIKNSDLAGKPAPKKVIADLLAFLRGSVLIMHDGREKLSILSFKSKGAAPDVIYDTSDLARIVAPTQITYDLEPLAHKLGATYDGPRGITTRTGCIAALWLRLLREVEQLSLPVITAINDLLKAEQHSLKPIFSAALNTILAKSFGQGKRTLKDIFRDFGRLALERPEPPAEEQPVTPLDVASITAIFDEGGLLANTMPFYERRGEQIEMVPAVCQALNEGKHLMIEAGMGTGKSLAYLVPAIYWAKQNNQKVIVSTNTKNLQAQIYFKDLPFLHETLGPKEKDYAVEQLRNLSWKTALIKGRKNYLCVRKFLYLMREYERELEGDERIAILPIITWAAMTDSGDIAENTAFGLTGTLDLWDKLSSDGNECSGRACKEFRQCFVYKARALALAADLVVANHAVVFAELGMEQSSVLPPYSVIVFDEAHNLENVATDYLSVRLYGWRIYKIVNRLHRARRDGTGKGLFTNIRHQLSMSKAAATPTAEAAEKRIQRIIGTLPEVGKAAESFFSAIGVLFEMRRQSTYSRGEDKLRFSAQSRRPDVWEDVEKEKKGLIAHLGGLAKSLEGLGEHVKELADAMSYGREFQREIQFQVDQLKELITDVEFVIAGGEENYVYWAARSQGARVQHELWAAPLDISVMMKENFFNAKRTIVLSSATLSVDGRFDFMLERIGAVGLPPGRIVCKDVGSSFDFERQTRLCIPRFLPEPREAGGAFEEKLAELLVEMFMASNGRGMALFTSYEMLDAVHPAVKERLEAENILVLGQGKDGSREAITALFQRDITSVLLGTQSFWEGVDFAGETLSLLVIAKLPFHVPTEPIVQARCELLESRGVDSFLHYTLPSAVIRLKQGFGRLIRTKTDRGIVVITDRRLLTQRYGQAFLRSLPTNHSAFADKEGLLEAIQGFLGEKTA